MELPLSTEPRAVGNSADPSRPNWLGDLCPLQCRLGIWHDCRLEATTRKHQVTLEVTSSMIIGDFLTSFYLPKEMYDKGRSTRGDDRLPPYRALS